MVSLFETANLSASYLKTFKVVFFSLSLMDWKNNQINDNDHYQF